MSDWIDRLRAETTKPGSSQRIVADRIGYSPSAISSVLKGKYKGPLENIRDAFELKFGIESVDCPVLGEVMVSRCLKEQRITGSRANRIRVALNRHCPTCRYNRKNGGDHADQ